MYSLLNLRYIFFKALTRFQKLYVGGGNSLNVTKGEAMEEEEAAADVRRLSTRKQSTKWRFSWCMSLSGMLSDALLLLAAMLTFYNHQNINFRSWIFYNVGVEWPDGQWCPIKRSTAAEKRSLFCATIVLSLIKITYDLLSSNVKSEK